MEQAFKLVEAPKAHYVEESQFMNCSFSFATWEPSTAEEEGYYKELFSPVICRDFLGDALYADQYKKPVSIYGFTYDPTDKTIVNSSGCYIVLHFANQQQKSNFLLNFSFLQEIEERFTTEHTQYITNGLKCILFCPYFWTKSAWAMSLYTFMIRCLCYPTSEGNFWDYIATTKQKEGMYIKKVNFFKITKNLKMIAKVSDSISGYPEEENLNMSQLHHASGFVSLFGNHIKGNVYSDLYHTKIANMPKNKAA